MNTYVLWIEMDKAKVFGISTEGLTTKVIKRHEMKHHTSRDPENHKNCEKFFHVIAEEIKGAEEILLMGPSLTKKHFKDHLDRHHHRDLSKAVIGSETLDIMTDEEVMDHARTFFKRYSMFGSPALSS